MEEHGAHAAGEEGGRVGELFLMVSMATEVLFTVRFFPSCSSARQLLICILLENAASKSLVWTGVGPWGLRDRAAGRPWSVCGVGRGRQDLQVLLAQAPPASPEGPVRCRSLQRGHRVARSPNPQHTHDHGLQGCRLGCRWHGGWRGPRGGSWSPGSWS